jgi:hypothetical protein
MEKQPLAATPGMGSIGIERLIALGNYENIRVGYVKSFALAQEKPDDVYAEVRAKVDGWAADLRFQKDNVKKMVSDALPEPEGKLAQIMDALKPFTDRLTITDSPSMIYIRTRGRMTREDWGECNTLIRAHGGSWRGTKEGLEGKDVHWEITK